ncbi:hypothetical protein ABIE44_001618 [Marmoricola sp. OAE513]|uniref:LytR C-terminal domain-containing protein n=1 Tax=Marmoricola sp. OAE513 TaxID=2817894 RepID=UPI001AE23AA4
MTSTPRGTVSAVSLAVTVVIVIVMAVWGVNALTAPIEDDGDTSSSTDDGTLTCAAGQELVETKFLKRSQVVVSVYNAGKKAGRARATLDNFEAAGFRAGEVGDAPERTDVRRAEVRAKASDAVAAGLVAQSLGKNTQVVVADAEDLGPGINVIIGDKFKNLDPKAPKRARLKEPKYSCV